MFESFMDEWERAGQSAKQFNEVPDEEAKKVCTA